mmetsp:Transcript_7603/g.15071  ORF Transcript_7603/g.15071 Transcript_7603/m.15071 type:complete len:80 (+) Transcript_7603:166-405(+)
MGNKRTTELLYKTSQTMQHACHAKAAVDSSCVQQSLSSDKQQQQRIGARPSRNQRRTKPSQAKPGQARERGDQATVGKS